MMSYSIQPARYASTLRLTSLCHAAAYKRGNLRPAPPPNDLDNLVPRPQPHSLAIYSFYPHLPPPACIAIL
ncbi:hypothetical protein NBRC10513_003971 [Rhodotorula toruloides]